MIRRFGFPAFSELQACPLLWAAQIDLEAIQCNSGDEAGISACEWRKNSLLKDVRIQDDHISIRKPTFGYAILNGKNGSIPVI
jgi:hypothetical protein